MIQFLAFLLLIANLYGEKVDIVSDFYLGELVSRAKMAKQTGLKVRFIQGTFDAYYENYYSPDVDKILVMNADIGDGTSLSKIPLDKRVLFMWEPTGVPSVDLLMRYSKIYTYNDDVIDNFRCCKFAYPVLMPMIKDVPSFNEKRFCVMITHRYSSERVRILKFFETKPFEDLEYYAYGPIMETPLYRGQIPGYPTGSEKLGLMKNFRFCVCFENHAVNGYITEKIFTCFAAGCVPVYFGAPNVEDYIPKSCFIDYRDFRCDEDLYQFLKSMPEGRYEEYLQNIERYLKSDKALMFSSDYFNQTILNCVKSI